jgi:hypothetical protein
MQETKTKATTTAPFAALLGTAAAALVLDIESTKYAQRDPEASEFNSWIYGERPSRSRMYAVSIPVTIGLAAWSAHLRSASCADAKSRWAWQFPLWALSVGHGIAAAANFIQFRPRASQAWARTRLP